MDTVASFLTVIRNAGKAKHDKVDVPSSNFRVGIAKILQDSGYIRTFKVAKDSKQGIIRIYLKYDDAGNHAIENIKKVSKPGRRVYVGAAQVPKVRSGLGMSVLSTSKGILSDKQAAQLNVGGELICTLW